MPSILAQRSTEPEAATLAIANHSQKGRVCLLQKSASSENPMPGNHSPSAVRHAIVAALAAPPRVERLGPIASRFIHALRLIAVHDRANRDPVPELAVRLGSVEVAAKALILGQAVAATWPDKIAISRFCSRLLSHDEATIGAFVDAAAVGDRKSFEAALEGFIRADRAHRLWDAALALAAAEIRAL